MRKPDLHAKHKLASAVTGHIERLAARLGMMIPCACSHKQYTKNLKPKYLKKNDLVKKQQRGGKCCKNSLVRRRLRTRRMYHTHANVYKPQSYLDRTPTSFAQLYRTATASRRDQTSFKKIDFTFVCCWLASFTSNAPLRDQNARTLHVFAEQTQIRCNDKTGTEICR